MKRTKNPTTNAYKTKALFWLSIGTLMLSFTILLYAITFVRQHPKLVISAVPQTPVPLNQPISMGVATMQVTNVTTSQGSQPFIAPPGKEYIITDLSIKNRSDKPVNVLPSTDTYLKNEHGTVYNTTPYALRNPLRAGQLLPGESISGQTSYLVPKQDGVKLYIDAIWSGGVIPFALK